jgi:signal peptide peptidase SppA
MIDAFVSACSQPWAITPDALRTLLTIADRGGDIEALQRKAGDRLANTRQVTIRSNGVAVVPITGTIFRYANLLTDISGATSTQVLATDITTALDNPAVRAIVLDINSPGGQAEGIAELARAINAGTARKPITAYIGGTGASAAYWLAAAATEIVVDRTALVGSIGVVAAVRDERQKDERAGVRKAEIVSSASPKKRLDPFSEEGASEMQKVVDALASVFIVDVAAYRGVGISTVKDNFGQGGVLVGQAAVAAGMVDRLGDLESTIARLGTGGPSVSRSQASTPAPAHTSGPKASATEIYARRGKERISSVSDAGQQSAIAAGWAESAARVQGRDRK